MTFNHILLKAQSMGFKSPQKTKECLMVARRLASFVNSWMVLIKDLWVLDTILKRLTNTFQRGAFAGSNTSRGKILKRTGGSIESRDRIAPFRWVPSYTTTTIKNLLKGHGIILFMTLHYGFEGSRLANETCHIHFNQHALAPLHKGVTLAL